MVNCDAHLDGASEIIPFWREQIGQFFPTQIHCKHLTRKIENAHQGNFPTCALKSRISAAKLKLPTKQKKDFFFRESFFHCVGFTVHYVKLR